MVFEPQEILRSGEEMVEEARIRKHYSKDLEGLIRKAD